MIKIYTTPSCQYCKLAKEYFKNKGVSYAEIDVAGNAEARNEMVEKSHQLGVPVIEIDNHIIVGFDRVKIDELLTHT